MGKVRNVHYGDILIKFGEIIDVSKDELPYIKDEVIAKSLSEDCLLQNSDVIFADAAEDNTVGKCAEIISINDEFVVSGLHTIPCRPSIGFSKGYLGYCLNANSFHDQLLPLIQGTKISSISKKALLSTTVSFPTDMEEQKQITSFLYNIDIQIQAEQQRLDKLKQMKSACLRSMFPQNGGGNLPLIRFKGFNREWKYFNFETLFSIVNDSKSNVPTNQYKTVGKYPIIDQSKDFIVGFTNNNNPIVPSSGYIIFGDHTREFKYVDFPFYTGADGTQILRCKQDDVVPIFAYYLCLSLTIPNTGYNRHLKYVKESRFPIPPSIEEQERIASFFRSLDTKISLQTQRIEKLKQLKTACLSRMIA